MAVAEAQQARIVPLPVNRAEAARYACKITRQHPFITIIA
jgi:hypothetical protein